jgi:hypothetical protein
VDDGIAAPGAFLQEVFVQDIAPANFRYFAVKIYL